MLGRCPIVATNTEVAYYGIDSDDTMSRPRPVSGAEVLGLVGDPRSQDCWPVVARPLLKIRSGHRLRDLLRATAGSWRLPPVNLAADPQDLPARACLYCEHPLPVDIDDRRIVTIAVLGTKSAGKTHYLATAMYQACRMQGLRTVGCEQFEPDERTAKDYHEKYFEPLFVHKQQLDGTSVDQSVRFSPLVFRVRFEDSPPCSLLFHDVSGEMLDDPKMRARYAQFIYRADGAILLVDPDQLTLPNGRHLAPTLTGVRTYNQADLLISWLSGLKKPIPVALTLSKSDLVTAAFPGKYRQLGLEPAGDGHVWSREMTQIDSDVREIFGELGAYDLLAAAQRTDGMTSFHAIAALGVPPDQDGTVAEFRPRRCLDPLVTLLTQIPDVIGPQSR